MNAKEYNVMIGKLKEATDMRMLEWEKKDINSDSSFVTSVGKCRVGINNLYDNVIDDYTYSLDLYNEQGSLFNVLSFSPSGEDGVYTELPDLYQSVRDSYYHITESEKDIMDNLNSMVPF